MQSYQRLLCVSQPADASRRESMSLAGVELAPEAASNLCLVVAVEAQDSEIIGIVVAGVFVYVVNLDRLSALVTHTTRSV